MLHSTTGSMEISSVYNCWIIVDVLALKLKSNTNLGLANIKVAPHTGTQIVEYLIIFLIVTFCFQFTLEMWKEIVVAQYGPTGS